MKDKFVTYGDIFDWSLDVPENLEKNSIELDKYVIIDLIILFQMKEICNDIDNVVGQKKNKLGALDVQLHHSYNELGERNDYEYRQNTSTSMTKNTERKKEITLISEKDKIDTLLYIKEKGMLVDKISFLNDNNHSIACFGAMLWDIDTWYDEDETPCVFILPGIILNAGWSIQSPEDDVSLEVNLDQIKEIIVDETRYIFMC